MSVYLGLITVFFIGSSAGMASGLSNTKKGFYTSLVLGFLAMAGVDLTLIAEHDVIVKFTNNLYVNAQLTALIIVAATALGMVFGNQLLSKIGRKKS